MIAENCSCFNDWQVSSQTLFHEGKAAAMHGQDAKFWNRLAVLPRRVAFVLAKTILWVNRMKLSKNFVPGDFGDYRGGRDRQNFCIALNHCFLFHIQTPDRMPAVEK